MDDRRVHIPALTSIRFFAALHVVAFHFVTKANKPAFLQGILSAGYVGVTLFFVLSGFILSHVYAGPFALRDFYRARFARIYPLYALALLLCVWTGGSPWIHEPLSAWLRSPLFLQAWWPQYSLEWNFPAWSLSCEAFFYLTFPLFARRFRETSPKTLLGIIALLWVVSCLPSIAYLWIQPDGPISVTYQTPSVWLQLLKYHPLVRLPEFMVGILLARLRTRIPTFSLAGTGAALSLAVIVGVLVQSYRLPLVLLHNSLLLPAFSLLIFSLSYPSWAARLLSARWLTFLGESSYGLYILQSPAWAIVTVAAVGLNYRTGVWMLLPVIGLAVVCYVAVERPARRFLYPKGLRHSQAPGFARTATAGK